MTRELQQAQRATRKVALAVEQRDEAIRAANRAGHTIRVIAAEVGLSAARVHQILHHR